MTSKRPSTFFNMVLTLFVISLIASAILGFVYEKTKEPIARVAIERKRNAIKAVVPDFDNNPIEDFRHVETSQGYLIFYYAKKGEKILAVAVDTFSRRGFSGLIRLMVGLLPDGTIHDISVISSNETPGLGDKIRREKSDFSKQFKGKNPNHFLFRIRQDGGDVDAITAATISSRAFCDAVERVYKYKNIMGDKDE